jgi:hypothetical protein
MNDGESWDFRLRLIERGIAILVPMYEAVLFFCALFWGISK